MYGFPLRRDKRPCNGDTPPVYGKHHIVDSHAITCWIASNALPAMKFLSPLVNRAVALLVPATRRKQLIKREKSRVTHMAK